MKGQRSVSEHDLGGIWLLGDFACSGTLRATQDGQICAVRMHPRAPPLLLGHREAGEEKFAPFSDLRAVVAVVSKFSVFLVWH